MISAICSYARVSFLAGRAAPTRVQELVLKRGLFQGARWEELLRRVPEKERGYICSEISDPRVAQDAKALVGVLQKIRPGENPFAHPLFSNHFTFPFTALAAVKEGLSLPQFATIQSYWALRADLPPDGQRSLKYVPLFDAKGAICGETLAKIERIIRPHELPHEDLVEPLLREMREAPASEQGFFSFVSEPITEQQHTLAYRLYQIDFNTFACLEDRMMPSHSFLEAILKVKFGKNAIWPHIVLGKSSAKDIYATQWEGMRDYMVPFPHAREFFADGWHAPDIQFPLHDFYHCYRASLMGPLFVKAMLKMADLFNRFEREQAWEMEEVHFDAMAGRFLDMEFPVFEPRGRYLRDEWTGQETQEVIFWHAWSDGLMRTKKFDLKVFKNWGFFRAIAREVFVTGAAQWRALGLTEEGFLNALKRLDSLRKMKEGAHINTETAIAHLKKGLHPLENLARELDIVKKYSSAP